MKYIVGKEHTQINHVYMYNVNKSKKIHIRGNYNKYLKRKNITYLNIAHSEHDPFVIYFIPCFKNEYDTTNKPVKLTFKKNECNSSFSCSKFFNELSIPQCKPYKTKDNKQKYEGHVIPYITFNIDSNRRSICFDTRPLIKDIKDIKNIKNIHKNLNESIKNSIAHINKPNNKITKDQIETDNEVLQKLLKSGTIHQIDLNNDEYNKYTPDIMIYNNESKCWVELALSENNKTYYVQNYGLMIHDFL